MTTDTTTRRLSTLAATALLLAAAIGIFEQHARGQARPAAVTPADYLRWRTELRNWGRWGPNDQKGTANLITPAKVQEAAKLVKAGIVVSMSHAVPQKVAADVGEAQVFKRTTNNIRRHRHDRQLSGQLPRPRRGPHRRLLSLLLRRADVQRLLGQGQHHARSRMQRRAASWDAATASSRARSSTTCRS